VATSPRCLCLVLTLRIAVLRSSAAVRTGSPDSVWWGTKESARLQDSIPKQIKTGNFAAGEALFDKCLGEELRRARHPGFPASCPTFKRWVPGKQTARGAGGATSPSTNFQFRETWSKVRAEDRLLLQTGGRKNPASDRFRLRLTEMEVQAGFGFSLNPIENFPSGDSLIHFQHGLRVSAARERIRGVVREFPIAVETGRTDTEIQSGRRLYETLFGRLRQEESRRPEQLPSLIDSAASAGPEAPAGRGAPVGRKATAGRKEPVGRIEKGAVRSCTWPKCISCKWYRGACC
jgi:hypothetical protein